jgi:hypothetical protein
VWKKKKEKRIKEMIKEEENEWWRIKRVKEYKNKKKKNCWAVGLSLQALLKWRCGLKWK